MVFHSSAFLTELLAETTHFILTVWNINSLHVSNYISSDPSLMLSGNIFSNTVLWCSVYIAVLVCYL